MQIQGVLPLQNQIKTIQSGGAAEQSFAPGESVTAEIVGSGDGSVKLQLPDGTQLSASQQASESLRPGDTVTLSVLSVKDGAGNSTATMQLVTVNGQPVKADVSTVEYDLMRLNIPADKLHTQLASAASDLGIAVSPRTIARMVALRHEFPQLNVSQAAVFAASELPVSAENVASYSQWLNGSTPVSQFADNLDKLALENPQLSQAVNALLSAELPVSTDSPIINNTPIAPDKQASAGITPQTAQTTSEALKEFAQAFPKMSVPEIRTAISDILTNAAPEQKAEVRQQLFDIVQQRLTTSSAQPTAQDAPAQQAGAAPSTAQPAPQGTSLIAPQATPQAAPQGAAPQVAAPQGTAPQGAAPQATQTAQQPDPTAGRTLGNAAAGLDVNADTARTSAQVKQTTTQLINSLFAVLDGSEESGEKLKQATSKLPERVLQLSDTLVSQLQKTSSEPVKAAAVQANALLSQMQMGGELGHLMVAQLPIMLHDQRQSAELYVLKRQHSGAALDEANATVALCLDTSCIGRVEALLRVEQNALSVQFRVDNDNIKRYVSHCLPQINELDFPSQYHLRKATVVTADTAIDPVNAAKVMQSSFNAPVTAGLDITV